MHQTPVPRNELHANFSCNSKFIGLFLMSIDYNYLETSLLAISGCTFLHEIIMAKIRAFSPYFTSRVGPHPQLVLLLRF